MKKYFQKRKRFNPQKAIMACLVLIFILNTGAAFAQVSRKMLYFAYVKKTAGLIKREFYKGVDDTRLIRGAFKNMRRVCPKMPEPASYTWRAFEQAYFSVSKAKPGISGTIAEAALDGMVNALNDPYSALLTPKKRRLLQQGDGSGIGLELGYKNGRIVIIAPIVGSPAEEAGIKSGDVLHSVNGKKVEGMNLYDASILISGRRGRAIDITVIRNGKKMTLAPVFAPLKIDPIRYALLNNNVGYVKIGIFNGKILKEFRYVLKQMKKRRVRGLIIDLRNNPGGDLKEALTAAARFVPSGVLVWIKSRGGKMMASKSGSGETFPAPVVILVNEGTASAAEVFTAALAENGKAIIMGRKTFGKGVIQTEFKLTGGARLHLTTESYLTASKKDINGRGIAPHVTIKSKKQSVDPSKDPFVYKAWEYINRKVK